MCKHTANTQCLQKMFAYHNLCKIYSPEKCSPFMLFCLLLMLGLQLPFGTMCDQHILLRIGMAFFVTVVDFRGNRTDLDSICSIYVGNKGSMSRSRSRWFRLLGEYTLQRLVGHEVGRSKWMSACHLALVHSDICLVGGNIEAVSHPASTISTPH